MKNILLFVLMVFSYTIISQTEKSPGGVKTVTFTVKGNCEQCKARIENAADIKGVKFCSWDEKTHIATVTYKPEKVTLEQIQKAIAASGHDAAEVKAEDAAYKKLPDCCKYRDGKCETPKKK
jgi:periplasmic mercuric ion binding protein